MPTFTDDFNRANGAAGAPWVNISGLAAPTITSNQMGWAASYPITSVNGDFDASVVLANNTAAQTYIAYGSGAYQYNNINFTGYVAAAATDLSIAQISRSVAGAATTFAGSNVSVTWPNGSVFRFMRSNQILRIYKDGVLVSQALEFQPLSGWNNLNIVASTTAVRWDDFFVSTESLVPRLSASLLTPYVAPIIAAPRTYITPTEAFGGGDNELAVPIVGQIWPRGNP